LIRQIEADHGQHFVQPFEVRGRDARGESTEIERPRVRGLAGKELALPSWERAVEEAWLRRVEVGGVAALRGAVACAHEGVTGIGPFPLDLRAPGVSTSIMEGVNEILTVTRLELPSHLRRSLACTNIIET
jgi:hypothetical protein